MCKRLHVRISGRVQGVGYRIFTAREARHLGLVGYVRNNLDGGVEVWAEGEEIVLQRLLKILHKGPPHAVVTNLQTSWGEPLGNFTDFSVRATSL